MTKRIIIFVIIAVLGFCVGSATGAECELQPGQERCGPCAGYPGGICESNPEGTLTKDPAPTANSERRLAPVRINKPAPAVVYPPMEGGK